MKKVALAILGCLVIGGCSNSSINREAKQETPDLDKVSKTMDTAGYETFSYKEGDTTYVMQKYFMVFLKKGPNRAQDSVSLNQIQMGHMKHLDSLFYAGKITMAGPYEDDSDISGIAVYCTQTFAEADSLANLDPAVKAGRLTIETHPWWAAKGSVLK